MERDPIHAGEETLARLDPEDERRFWQGVEGAARFFMGDSDVQRALERLVGILEAQNIPYAVVGAMALNEFGYRRVTVDVDVLLTPAGLEALKAASLGRGYVEKFPGSRGLRDTENGVDIDVFDQHQQRLEDLRFERDRLALSQQHPANRVQLERVELITRFVLWAYTLHSSPPKNVKEN